MSTLSKGRQRGEVVTQVAMLCKFYEEDGVWNGTTADLPIAVFGNSLKEAQDHLEEAISCHFEALKETNQLASTLEYLQRRAKEVCLSMDEFPSDRFLVRRNVAVQHDGVCAVI